MYHIISIIRVGGWCFSDIVGGVQLHRTPGGSELHDTITVVSSADITVSITVWF